MNYERGGYEKYRGEMTEELEKLYEEYEKNLVIPPVPNLELDIVHMKYMYEILRNV